MGKRKKKQKTDLLISGEMVEDLGLTVAEDVFVDEDMCYNCKFWKGPAGSKNLYELAEPLSVERVTSDTKGICRRFPNKDTIYREPNKWCGEHQRRN